MTRLQAAQAALLALAEHPDIDFAAGAADAVDALAYGIEHLDDSRHRALLAELDGRSASYRAGAGAAADAVLEVVAAVRARRGDAA